MKQQQNHHSSRCLLQPSASDHPSLICDHRSAMKEVARGQSLLTQLRAIILPALLQTDERSELVTQMFQNILDCSCKAMAELQQLHQSRNARADDDVLMDDKKRVRRISSDCCNKEEGVSNANPQHQRKRRRFDESVSLETPVPHYDGRQWRKYGQKHINKAKHPRSYYRCTYRQEQGCKATKTVQQKDDNSGSADHPLMYTVVYHGKHTCKENDGVNSGPDESEANARSSSDSRSSISSTSTDPYDHQTSLDADNKLIDESEDLVTKNSLYEPFDMAAFAALDLDSWELDALLRFGA